MSLLKNLQNNAAKTKDERVDDMTAAAVIHMPSITHTEVRALDAMFMSCILENINGDTALSEFRNIRNLHGDTLSVALKLDMGPELVGHSIAKAIYDKESICEVLQEHIDAQDREIEEAQQALVDKFTLNSDDIYADRHDTQVHNLTNNAELTAGHVYEFSVEEDGERVNFGSKIRFQNGSVTENGINGVSTELVLAACRHRIEELDKLVPCAENKTVEQYLSLAIHELEKRGKDRVKRGVNGTDKP